MKRPIKEFKLEILEEIKSQTLPLEEKFNLINEKLVNYEKIIDDSKTMVSEYREKFDVLFNFFTQEEPEPSEDEIKKQQEEAQEQMSIMIQNAIVTMLNKPENQEAIGNMISNILGQATGGAGGSPLDNLFGEDGGLNMNVAAKLIADNFKKGSSTRLPVGQPVASRSGKSTGY